MTKADAAGAKAPVIPELTPAGAEAQSRAIDRIFLPPLLRHLARRAFADRNSLGAPPTTRVAIKAAVRSELRKCLAAARAARDAFRAADQTGYLVKAALAQRHADAARAEFFAFFARQAKGNYGRKGEKAGGAPPSPWAAEWERLVLAKRANNRSLSQTEALKQVAAAWKDKEQKPRSWTTMRDAIATLRRNRT